VIIEYHNAIGFAPKDAPLFRTTLRKTGRLTEHAMTVKDMCRWRSAA
jgi:hypothetical protein